MSDVLHIQDEQKPKLTLCGAWSRGVTILGDDLDDDERPVCLRCTRRLLALRTNARLIETYGTTSPRVDVEGPPGFGLSLDARILGAMPCGSMLIRQSAFPCSFANGHAGPCSNLLPGATRLPALRNKED